MELKSKAAFTPEGAVAKRVQFFVDNLLVSLQGDWTWDLPVEELFCSDVMVALNLGNPAEAKCLLHPDDLQSVRNEIDKAESASLQFSFRVITSWGKIHTIEGRGRFEVEKDEAFSLQLQQVERDQFTRKQQQKEQLEKANLQLATYQYAELLTGQGVWWYNTSQNKTYYSDNLYRIYGLPPQGLNAHLHTFTPFIHPEDREVVLDIFEQAFKAMVPVNLEYRIQTQNSEQKFINLTTRWIYNEKGEQVLCGVVTDKTEDFKKEQERTGLLDDLEVRRSQLRNSEVLTKSANWHINLYTRQIDYSENIYRIYGIKAPGANPGILINYVHPDDRELVAKANKRIYAEHIVPELEFRIVRPDGKIRHLQQKGKMIINSQKEMIIIGTTKDVTDRLAAARMIQDLEQDIQSHLLSWGQAEESGNMGSGTWNLVTGEMHWSNGLYTLFGYKASAIHPSHKLLLNFVHPEDRNRYEKHTGEVVNGTTAESLAFRIVRKGETRYVRGHFRLVSKEAPNLLLISLVDYTDQYLAEQKLATQVNLADLLIHGSLDTVYVTDSNNYVIKWSARCEEAYGIKRDKAIGKNIFELFPELKSTMLLEGYHAALNGETQQYKEYKAWVRQGIYDISLVPVMESNDEVVAVITIIHNATGEYDLKQQLTGRLTFIERFLEASIDRIIVLDRHMNYLYWNKRAEEYYNIPKEEVLGRNILDVSPGLINDPTYTEFRQALRGETVHIPAAQNLEARKGYFETYLIPIQDEKGQVESVLWIVHDLTSEYQLQQQQKRAGQVLNRVQEGCVELDSEGIFRYLNRRAEELWNTKKEDLLGRSVWETFTENVDAEGYNLITQALNDKVAVQAEYFSTARNHWMHLSVTPSEEGAVVLFNDIQEQKETHQLQQAIFNASLFGIVLFRPVYDESGEITDFEMVLHNRVAAEWSQRDLVGAKYSDVFPAVKKNGILEGFKEVMHTGEPMDREFHYKGDGLDSWYRISAVRFGNDLLSTAEDITRRKQTEEKMEAVNRQLEESQQYAQRIVDATPDVITIYDLQKGDAIYMNRTIGTILGYTVEELKAMGHKGRAERIIYPDDLPALNAFNEAMRSATDEDVHTIEYRVRCKDGDVLWIKNRSKVFKRNSQGDPTHMISILQNITEEKTLTRQLRERTTFVEHLIDASVDRIFALDGQMVLRAWNRQCEQYYKVKKEDALGRPLLEIFPHVQENAGFMKALADAINGQQVQMPAEKEIYLDTISERFFIPVHGEEGQEPVVLCILHDVTRDFEAKEELRSLNKTLERKNRELQEKHDEITSFAFVSSHDLKEPLRKIHTFSDWLLHKEEEHVSATGKKYLVKLNDSVRRLETLIDDILVLTKIHSERKKPVPVDLNHLLVRVQEELQESIEGTGATITAGVLPVVAGQENQLLILFKNLIANALKFQPPGNKPQVRIDAEILEGAGLNLVGVPEEKQYFRVSFTDNGLGFDPRYARKIFQVFQRLHGPQDYPGTGMGLAICRKIMENHEGFIAAESEEGRGSTFHCYFPVN